MKSPIEREFDKLERLLARTVPDLKDRQEIWNQSVRCSRSVLTETLQGVRALTKEVTFGDNIL